VTDFWLADAKCRGFDPIFDPSHCHQSIPPAPLAGQLELLASGQGGLITLLQLVLAQACLASGEVDRAGAVADLALHRARQVYPLFMPDALRAQAMVRGQQDRWEEAGHALEEVVSLARDLLFPYAQARALYQWAEIESQKGDLPHARKLFEEALVIFQRLGAKPYLARTAQALRSLTLLR
jgi:tetratricopeptide (TPR) repeat protein